MKADDRLRELSQQLVDSRAETWGTIFTNATDAETLQQSIDHCRQIEGSEKTARFLVRSLGATPMGHVLAYLVDTIDKLRNPDPEHGPPRVLKIVAAEFGVSPKDLTGDRRLAQIVLPRHVAMYVMRTSLRMSLADIGIAFGNRDHTTVVYALEKITRRIRTEEAFKNTVEKLQLQVGAP